MTSTFELFVKAIKKEDVGQVKALLFNNFKKLNIDKAFLNEYSYQTTALHEAVKCQNEDLVKVLLCYRARVNQQDYRSMRPINYAAQQGCDTIITDLIEAGAEVDCPDNLGYQPLCRAVHRCLPHVVSLLLDSGSAAANNLQDYNNYWLSNAVTHAAIVASYETLKVVVNHPSINLVDFGCFNIFSLILAEASHLKVVRLKIVMEAVEKRHGLETLRSLLTKESNINGREDDPYKYKTVNSIFLSRVYCMSVEERKAIIQLLASKNIDLGWKRPSARPVWRASMEPQRVGDTNILEDCIIHGDLESARLAIINGVSASPLVAFRSKIRRDQWPTSFKLLAVSQSYCDLEPNVMEELSLETEEETAMVLKWMTQPKSLKHLARSAWLNQKPVAGNKEDMIKDLDLPLPLKAYLRIDNFID